MFFYKLIMTINGYRIRRYIDWENKLLLWSTFIGHVGGRGWMLDIIILARWEYHFIGVHENLVQHPSNYKSISIGIYYLLLNSKMFTLKLF